MAVRPDLVQAILKKIAANERGNLSAGSVPEYVNIMLKNLDAQYVHDNLNISDHGLFGDRITRFWPPEYLAKKYDKLLTSKTLFAAPNYPERGATEALIAPGEGRSLFAPTSEANGDIMVHTLYPEKTQKILDYLKSLGWNPKERSSEVERALSDLGYKLKGVLPIAATAAGAASLLGTPGEAQASPMQAPAAPGQRLDNMSVYDALRHAGLMGEDKPLEKDPWLDPVSMALAPIGVAGALPRLGAALLDPPVSWGAEKAAEGFGTFMDWMYPKNTGESYARP
ncbi:MAG: hypothetical protein FWG59_01885 [Betaproteobacteria bacterium]|nr:hypothetical protein [Betaproteobacteria bacterium]